MNNANSWGLINLSYLQHFVRKECRALHLCRQSATASKHWCVEQHADPTVQTIVTGETGWTIYFKDGETKIPADQVFIAARDFWFAFIRHNEIDKALDRRALDEASVDLADQP